MTLRVEYECPDGTPFPVEWPDAEMAQHGWRWDQLHNPTPLTPLASDFAEYKGGGFLAGGAAAGRPIRGERVVANGYRFGRQVPLDPDEFEFATQAAERDTEQFLPVILDLWEEHFRPEVEALFRGFQHWASADETLPTLMQRFDEVAAMARRLGELHVLSWGRAASADQPLEAFCGAEFGAEGHMIATEAIAGMPNKSLESAYELWQLSRVALDTPAVAALLRERTPAEFLDELATIEGGPAFRTALDGYLDVYGHRNESFSELVFETWREDPRFVVFLLKHYIDTPADESPSALHARAMERREARTEDVRERLNDPEKFEEFLELQRIGQPRTILLEDHNYYIDQRAFSIQRVPCLAIGRLLVEQGSISDAADVFYLFVAELHEAASDPAMRYQQRVEERRAERDRWMHTLPPNVIGDGDVELDERMASFMGPVDAEPAAPGEVRGLASSPGIVRGTARIVRGSTRSTSSSVATYSSRTRRHRLGRRSSPSPRRSSPTPVARSPTPRWSHASTASRRSRARRALRPASRTAW